MLGILNTHKNIEKLLKVTGVFITLIVVIVSWEYAYAQAYNVYIKFVQFLVINYTSVKFIKKRVTVVYIFS